MRSMVPSLFTAMVSAGLLLLDLASPRPAPATTIDLSWNTCSPIQAVLPGSDPGLVSLYVSAIGQDELHFGYQFRYALSGPYGVVPDAWGFDAGGCQTGYGLAFYTRPNSIVAKTCPAFAGPFTTAEAYTFQYEFPGGLPELTGTLSHSYEARSGPREPTQRYFLARLDFNHEYSVIGASTPGAWCGGFEQPICIELLPAHSWWLNFLQQPVGFAVGSGTVGFRESCTPLPAAPSTWGAIKGQYRR